MHRPFSRHTFVSVAAFVLLVAAFILFLLVALSLPIIKPVYILSIKSTLAGQVPTDVATEIRFGVWGFCATSVLDPPTWLANDGECYGPKLGYDIPQNLTDLAGISSTIVDAVEQGLLVILVLHPIAAGFTFLGFLTSIFLGPHSIAIFALIIAIITAIVGTVVFAIDIALVVIVQKKIIDETTYQIEALFGPAVWMILVSIVMSWLAIIFLSARACYCCGVRREHNHKHWTH